LSVTIRKVPKNGYLLSEKLIEIPSLNDLPGDDFVVLDEHSSDLSGQRSKDTSLTVESVCITNSPIGEQESNNVWMTTKASVVERRRIPAIANVEIEIFVLEKLSVVPRRRHEVERSGKESILT